MKILVSGSSGFIGSALVAFLEKKGETVFKLVRGHGDLHPNDIGWDPQTGFLNASLLEGFDAVVHLAGENIMGRWTQKKKEKIYQSRVEGTRVLCNALSSLNRPPAVFIAASAIGYYGDRGDEILTEESATGEGFLAEVCEEWEKASSAVDQRGIRRVNLRIGMVVSSKGGALKQMLPIFKLGLGGRLGTGQQWVSWIALDDLIRIVDFALRSETVSGGVNAVAPHEIRNAEFTHTLGNVLHRPTLMTVPSFALKLCFGELGKEVLLASTRVMPEKLERAGFTFLYPTLEAALR